MGWGGQCAALAVCGADSIIHFGRAGIAAGFTQREATCRRGDKRGGANRKQTDRHQGRIPAAGWTCKSAERSVKGAEEQAGEESRQSSLSLNWGGGQGGVAVGTRRMQKAAAAVCWEVVCCCVKVVLSRAVPTGRRPRPPHRPQSHPAPPAGAGGAPNRGRCCRGHKS